MIASIQIGHLLRAGTAGFVAGCSVSQLETPSFGALVRAPIGEKYSVYGLIYDIHIDDDGLVMRTGLPRLNRPISVARVSAAADAMAAT